MADEMIVSQEFMTEQLNRAKEAAHLLTDTGDMSRNDTLALQILADLCRALRKPLLEDPRHIDQQRLITQRSFEDETHKVRP